MKCDGGRCHIPFRNSQLTRVLAESFTRRDALMVTVATLSPSAIDTEHSLATLETVSELSGGAGLVDVEDSSDANTVSSGAASSGSSSLGGSNSGNNRNVATAASNACTASTPTAASAVSNPSTDSIATSGGSGGRTDSSDSGGSVVMNGSGGSDSESNGSTGSCRPCVNGGRQKVQEVIATRLPPMPLQPRLWTAAQVREWVGAPAQGALAPLLPALPPTVDGKQLMRMSAKKMQLMWGTKGPLCESLFSKLREETKRVQAIEEERRRNIRELERSKFAS